MHTLLLLYIIIIIIIIITVDNYLANQMWFSMVCTLIDNDTHHHMIMIMIHIITNYVVDTGGTRVKLSCNIINVTVPLGVVIATTNNNKTTGDTVWGNGWNTTPHSA